MSKKMVLRLTKKDFRIDWFSGSGAGGQKRNKVKNCCRIHHDPSGAMAVSQEHREGPKNLKAAFERICQTKELKNWLRVESLKKLGQEVSIDETVERQMKEAIIEVKDENGNWKKEK